ncbi:vWA domain-containing protein [Xanthocytophaga flava]|uniref:vWA domain-containing protein n=1 Tax=Xanthocytophaga flava TaxID=3048013 RepID=UPI0028D699E7|nr:VWA domain-containing protein [Xanthocytophaga flavus]MDJ1466277.1 VWA domain-containing protein [Xanthocytophaga flavus]
MKYHFENRFAIKQTITKHIILVLFFLLTHFMSQAQSKISSRNQAVDALNGYVQYTNETIHALWPIYEELMNFNLQLNYYSEEKSKFLSFQNEDHWNKSSSYEVIPAEIYQKCMTGHSALSETDRRVLNQRLLVLKETIDRIQLSRDSIWHFVQEKVYLQRTNIVWAYRQLGLLEKLFNQYDQAKDNLYATVQQVYLTHYKPTNTNHRIVAMADKFQPAIHWCKLILDDLDNEETSKISFYVQELETLIENYKTHQDENLQGLYRFGSSNGLDPYWRYERVVRNLEAIVSRCHSFLTSEWRENNYKPYSKAYYYYNNDIINKYNRYGLGLIRSYNDFIELADGKGVQKEAEIPDYYIQNKSIKLDVSTTVLLHQVEEPHQYKVFYPKTNKLDDKPAISIKPEPDKKTADETLEGYADNHLVFLLDVSGSMNSHEKLPLLKEAFSYLLTLTRPEDKVAIVSYSGDARIELNTVSATERKKIESKLDKLKSEGGTNIRRGVSLAYQLANEYFIKNGNNRIILASDGEFGLDKATEAIIQENLNRGIVLTVFLFGQTKNEHVIEQLQRLASLGKGNFQEITPENAKQTLLKEAQSIKKW